MQAHHSYAVILRSSCQIVSIYMSMAMCMVILLRESNVRWNDTVSELTSIINTVIEKKQSMK